MDELKVNSRTNFFAQSSYNKSVLSANLVLEPPETIASILVRYSISHCATLPINSTSKKYIDLKQQIYK